MAPGKRYLLEMECDDWEVHEGQRWIDEDELERIKEKSEDGKMPSSCSMCTLTVKDEDGNVLYATRGC